MIPFLFLPLGSQICESWLQGKQCHVLPIDSKCIDTSGKSYLGSLGYCYLFFYFFMIVSLCVVLTGLELDM